MKTNPILVAALALFMTACGVNRSVHQKALDRIVVLESDVAERDEALSARGQAVASLSGELDSTKADRDAKAAKVADKDAALSAAGAQAAATQAELVELRRARDAALKRAAAYKDLQGKFAALVDTGALKVTYRGGQMVLQLPSGVLFASAKAGLTKDGETSLAQITSVLDQFKDRKFMIAGHTDNLPIKSRAFKNNWYLSTARAISVLEFMVEAGFPAKNLAAAGYGAEDPVADNNSEEGREQNRRIEIILVPNLEELPTLAATAP